TPIAAPICSKTSCSRMSTCSVMVRSKVHTAAASSSASWRTTSRMSITSCCPGSKTKPTFTSRSKHFWERESDNAFPRPDYRAPFDARIGARARPDRTLRAGVRPGFLRDHFRDSRFRRDEYGCGLRRLSEPLSALEVRDGVRTAEQELRLRPAQDLRDGH